MIRNRKHKLLNDLFNLDTVIFSADRKIKFRDSLNIAQFPT